MSAIGGTPWLVAGPSGPVPGWILGGLQQRVLAEAVFTADTAELRRRVAGLAAMHPRWAHALAGEQPQAAAEAGSDPVRVLALWLAHWSIAVQRRAALAVVEQAALMGVQPVSGGIRVQLALPAAPGAQRAAADAFVGVLEALRDGLGRDDGRDVDERLGDLATRVAAQGPRRDNTARFLRAAAGAGIPVLPLGSGMFQFGLGARARWLESSFTDASGHLGVMAARDKRWTHLLLAGAGLPVAPQRLVADADAAVAAAAGLGYPVVVKPSDLDGGRGVATGLAGERAVRVAVAAVQAASTSPVLVEKHVPGRDYRLTVLHGRLLWAIERVPGGVTGDGRHSIRELLATLNAEPRRRGPHSPLKPVPLDTEAGELIAEAGFTPDSVLPEGRVLALRRMANVGSGGMPVAVNATVHPDNAALAERAARLLRLDLAGVDLLLPDIGRPWHETGGVVCEVNAQPQIGATTGPHLYGEILQGLLEASGRVPTLVLMGAEDGLLAEVVAGLRARGLSVGWADGSGVHLDGETLLHRPPPPVEAARLLALEPRAGAIVLGVNDLSVVASGSPLPRIDVLVFAGRRFGSADGAPADPSLVSRAMGVLVGACDGVVVELQGSGLASGRPREDAMVRRVPPEDAAALAVEQALACDARRQGQAAT